MIIIDNYDSFTYNIVQYLKELRVEPQIFKNDEITVSELKKMNFSSIIISPGPGSPDNAGVSMDVISEFYKTKKILGICLGHQCIAKHFGCKVIKAKNPMHGKVSKIHFQDDILFRDIKQDFEATRYHSLIVDNSSLTDSIKPLAYADFDNSLIMALKHKAYPVYGVQFHPEAILTQFGRKLLENFMSLEA